MPLQASESNPPPPHAAKTAAQALALLAAGNQRFVAEAPQPEAQGQAPYAVVLGCSDSRVPIETIFDQPPGRLFVVRVAGNFLNEDNLASIEFSVAVLKSKLVLVLGHSSCGAIEAAVAHVNDGTTQPGYIQDLVAKLGPAARNVRANPGDWVANAVVENVKLNVAAMTGRSAIIAQAVKSGEVEVKGGVYDLRSGSVTFL